MKRIAIIFMSLALAAACTACVFDKDTAESTVSENTATADSAVEEIKGDYKIALITDSEGISAQGNLTAWEGVVTYGDSTSTSYKYYSAADDSSQAVIDAVDKAVDNGAKIVILPSADFKAELGELQDNYPNFSFLIIDDTGSDSSTVKDELSENIHIVEFKEEQAGYLAGYLSVMDGYRTLGFIGDGENDSNMRYVYGLVQGADDATQELRIHDVSVKYTFIEPKEDKAKSTAKSFYDNGAEVIFACNSDICQGVAVSAEECGGKLICGEGNDGEFGDIRLTTVVYNANEAIELSLASYFSNNGEWVDGAAGAVLRVGVENGCISLATDEGSWHFENLSENHYKKLCEKFINGEVEISSDADRQPPIAAVTYKYVEY